MSDNANKKPKSSSAVSSWIGFLVLAFGVLSVATVGFLIYGQKAGGDRPDAAEPQAQLRTQAQVQNDELATALNTSQARNAKPPKAKDVRNLNVADVAGVWNTDLEETTSVLELAKDQTYRMMVADKNGRPVRYHSSGSYEIVDGTLLVFRPDTSIPPPQDEFTYRALLIRPMAVSVERQGDYMVWTRPPADAPVLVSVVHPFLRMAAEEIAVWDYF